MHECDQWQPTVDMMYTATTCHQQNGHTSSRINNSTIWQRDALSGTQEARNSHNRRAVVLLKLGLVFWCSFSYWVHFTLAAQTHAQNKWCHTPGGKYLLNKCHVSHSEVRLAVYGGSVMYSEMLPVEDNTLLTELCMSSPGDCHNKFNWWGPHLLPVSPCPSDAHHSGGRVLVQHWETVAAVLWPQVALKTGRKERCT